MYFFSSPIANFISSSLRSSGGLGRVLVGRLVLVRVGDELRLRDPDVADQLHRQRRAAPLAPSSPPPSEPTPARHERGDVDAAVLVEAAVLAGDDRVLEGLRDLVPLELDAVLAVERREGRRACPPWLAYSVLRCCSLPISMYSGIDSKTPIVFDGRHAGDRDGGGHPDGHEEAGQDAEADEPEERPDDGRGLRFLGRHRIRVSDTADIRAEQEATNGPLGVHDHAAHGAQQHRDPEQLGLRRLGTGPGRTQGPEGGLVAWLKRPRRRGGA